MLPNTYVQLEYLQANEQAYINTGYILNSNCKVVISYQFMDANYCALYGSRTNYMTGDGFVLTFYWNSNGNLGWHYGGYSELGTSYSDTNRHTIEQDRNILKLDGTVIGTRSEATFTCPTSSLLFHADTLGLRTATLRMFDAKFYDNDILVRDFIPVKKLSDSSLGMYDLVNDTFYSNANTSGYFTGGQVLDNTSNIIIEDNPLELTLESDVELQANFEIVGQQVSASIDPIGYGSVSGTGIYTEGATVILKAHSNYDKQFTNWTKGSETITTNPYVFTMGSSPVNVTANFGNLTSKGNCILFHRRDS